MNWLEALLGRAGRLSEEHLANGDAALVEDGLDDLRAAAPSLVRLGSVAHLVSVLVRLDLGDQQKARALYLSYGASFEELRGASHQATADAVANALAREEAWETLKEALIELGPTLARLVVVLLAAA